MDLLCFQSRNVVEQFICSDLLTASAPLTETRTCPLSPLSQPEARSLRGKEAVPAERRWGSERSSTQESAPHGPGHILRSSRLQCALEIWLSDGAAGCWSRRRRLPELLPLKPVRGQRPPAGLCVFLLELFHSGLSDGLLDARFLHRTQLEFADGATGA